MFRRFVVSVILSCCASAVWAADVPRYAQELSSFTESKSGGDQSVRMRITVASEAAQAEQSVRVGDVLLCSSSQCYRAHTSGYLNIANTAKGKADVVVDVWIPIATITDVYFTEIGGLATMNGHLKLETPLAIDKEFPGVELMISVKKQSVGTRTNYIPAQSASMYFADDNELVHYLPSVQTVAELSLGTKLTIPAGALDKPQIFNVGIVRAGEVFPKIDIFPYISLKKSASVEVRALRNADATHELIMPINPAEGNEDSVIKNAPTTLPLVKHTFNRTSVIEPSVLEKSLPSNVPGASSSSSAASPPKSCSEYLAQPFVLGMINVASLHYGAARITACEKIPPFVHIVYVLLGHKQINFSIPYKTSGVGNGSGPSLRLQRITSLGAAPSNAVINGFTWKGALGMVEGDTGKALGIVRSNGFALGDNIEGGGAGCASCAADKLQFVMAFSGDKAHPTFLSTRLYSDISASSNAVVSTTTSVVNNGVCQTPGTPSRWSAVGAFNGRMVLISSTTTGQTSAAELCPVFKALAIKDALRLDGGPSASLMVTGELLNALDGRYRLMYGLSRRVPYALRISP